MNSKQVDLDRLSKQETYSIAISLLYSLRDRPQYSVISELPYILDYDNFVKFIKYYGGMTIKIPTLEEISDIFKVLLLYQYRVVKNMNWIESLVKAGFSESESESAKFKLNHLSRIIESQDLGDRKYD